MRNIFRNGRHKGHEGKHEDHEDWEAAMPARASDRARIPSWSSWLHSDSACRAGRRPFNREEFYDEELGTKE